jgi:hypothetical protein
MLSNMYKPISGKDILKWLPNATVLKYTDLKKYKVLPKLPIILLYEIKNNVGHWTSILRTPEGIEHFDSYGYVPDDEFEFIPDKFKYESNQNYKYLLNLLYNANETINYNPYKLQGEPPIATCGRWAILRNLFNNLTIDQFANMINKTAKQLNISLDELVTRII